MDLNALRGMMASYLQLVVLVGELERKGSMEELLINVQELLTKTQGIFRNVTERFTLRYWTNVRVLC